MRDFKKLLIWQEGMDLVEDVYRLTSCLPDEERCGLRSNATRAAVAMVLHLTESSLTTVRTEFNSHLKNAMSAAMELKTSLMVMLRFGWINWTDCESLMRKVLVGQRLIGTLMNK